MKILVVDNNTRHIQAIRAALSGYELEVQKYSPGIMFNWPGKDLVILAGGGGEGREANDNYKGQPWYKDELKLIKECPLPMVGICMGFELMARAYGGKIKKLKKSLEGFEEFTTKNGRVIKQYESHEFAVTKLPVEHFEVLAKSKYGPEIFLHKSRPLIGTQFHPELGGTLSLPDLISAIT